MAETQVLRLPYFGAVVEIAKSGDEIVGCTIESDLLSSDENPELTIAFNVIEAFILAAVSAGLDVETPAFAEVVETVASKAIDNYGD